MVEFSIDYPCGCKYHYERPWEIVDYDWMQFCDAHLTEFRTKFKQEKEKHG